MHMVILKGQPACFPLLAIKKGQAIPYPNEGPCVLRIYKIQIFFLKKKKVNPR